MTLRNFCRFLGSQLAHLDDTGWRECLVAMVKEPDVPMEQQILISSLRSVDQNLEKHYDSYEKDNNDAPVQILYLINDDNHGEQESETIKQLTTHMEKYSARIEEPEGNPSRQTLQETRLSTSKENGK